MRLIFDYDPRLTLDSIIVTLMELYPEYPIKNKSNVIRIRKTPVSTVGIDLKEDFDNRQSIVQIYHKPSLGAQLFTGVLVHQTASSFVQEVGLALKTRLASQYHLLEESAKVKPRWTLRNKVAVAYLSLFLLFMIAVTLISVINRNIHTLVYDISAEGHFSGEYDATKIRGGKIFVYKNVDGADVEARISKDSTYFYNQSDDDWLLYSVDYISNSSATIPDRITILLPPHSLTSAPKTDGYIRGYNHSQTVNLSEEEFQRGYARKFFIQEISKALEDLFSIYGEDLFSKYGE